MIVNNKGGKGNPNHDAQGKFTTAGNTGQGGGQQQTSPSDDNQQNVQQTTPKKINLSSYLKQKNTNNDDTNQQKSELTKKFDKLRNDKFIKERKARTASEVVENIHKFFDEDVCSFVEKWGMHTSVSMGAGSTMYASKNNVLTNAIAAKQFVPLTVLSDDEFDDLKRQAEREKMAKGGYYSTPDNKLKYIQRGFGTVSNQGLYTGEKQTDVKLPMGMWGSCVYSAYDDGRTARSYGSHVMEIVMEEGKSNTIKYQSPEYNKFLNEFKKRVPEMRQRIEQHLLKKGKDTTYAQRMGKIFENTIRYDTNFPFVVAGYDAIFAESHNFCLLLNFNNMVTKKLR